MSDDGGLVRIQEIMDILPHRFPFLMVDRVLEYEPGQSIKAVKNVSINEPFFQGHFPGLPVMPGVLQLEAMAQAGGLLLVKSSEGDFKDKVLMFTGMEKVRFRRPVVPGDQLVLDIFDMRRKLKLVKMTGRATVDGQLAAQAELTAAVVDREDV